MRACTKCGETKPLAFVRSAVARLFASLAKDPPAIQLRLDAGHGICACRVCKQTKPLTEFSYRSVKRQTRQWICLLCQRVYTVSGHMRNRKRHIAKVEVRSSQVIGELRSRVRDYFA
jgi:hypothetical protein